MRIRPKIRTNTGSLERFLESIKKTSAEIFESRTYLEISRNYVEALRLYFQSKIYITRHD